MLEGGRGLDADAQVLGGERDGRGELERGIHRDLHALVQRVVILAFVDVIVANHVGDEDGVEKAALQDAGKISPVVQVLVGERQGGAAECLFRAENMPPAEAAQRRFFRGLPHPLRTNHFA